MKKSILIFLLDLIYTKFEFLIKTLSQKIKEKTKNKCHFVFGVGFAEKKSPLLKILSL